MRCPVTAVAPLLPHSGNMVLLDEIVTYDAEQLQARAEIRDDHVFLQPDRSVPVWLAVEIMAQGIAAFDGCHATDEGRPVRLGFLLGSRKLILHQNHLPVGAKLEVIVRASVSDGSGFSLFDCQLRWLNAPKDISAQLPAGTLVAEGTLNVFQPSDNPEGQTAL